MHPMDRLIIECTLLGLASLAGWKGVVLMFFALWIFNIVQAYRTGKFK